MKKIQTHVLGFPRSGAGPRTRHAALQAAGGLDLVSVGDDACAAQVAAHLAMFGCAQAGPAMASWFDTPQRYPVPDWSRATRFTLDAGALLAEVKAVRADGRRVKAVLIGPLTLLWLGRMTDRDACLDPGIDPRLDLLEHLLPAYAALLIALKGAGADWVQLDEPILGLDLPHAWRHAFERTYWQLAQCGAQLMLATYFAPLRHNISLACRLPVAGLHVDGVCAEHELTSVCDWLAVPKVLSVGIVDGRRREPTDRRRALAILQPLAQRRAGQLWLAPACSLQHAPAKLAPPEADPAAHDEAVLASANARLDELAALAAALERALHSAPADAPLCAGAI